MPPLEIYRSTVRPGERQRIQIPVSRLPTETWLSLPIEVVHGTKAGPRVWLSAAVHGDEINGVEIIRRVMDRLNPARLHGTVIAVPIVNVFGFMNQSRYLPDRRDLNRSFPGSSRGSLASRLANLFMQEVVWGCTHGIDLHTGSNHRANLPQIRTNLGDSETRRCAEAFGAPVMMHADTRDGSLREAATKQGIHVLLYEGGQPLRFDEPAIALGTKGVLRVLAALGMRRGATAPRKPSIELADSRWVRARRSGILHLAVELGEPVRHRQTLGTIADAFGDNRMDVTAPHDGVVIGHTNNPLVNQGDGIIHVARGDFDELVEHFAIEGADGQPAG
ncbi:MAG: succinylglutamate desuccinylase/aspartoacylase family protein [Planctomycetes bacterium]|nr:succinylglutamate desuccinylase/aspartoacylase family protein [Planctomycetota bacterium]